MPFGVAKNGMRMYMPSWQMNPGAAMKAANRAASDSYYANFSSLGSNLINTGLSETASMMELTTKMVTERLQADYDKKLRDAQSGLTGLDMSV